MDNMDNIGNDVSSFAKQVSMIVIILAMALILRSLSIVVYTMSKDMGKIAAYRELQRIEQLNSK